MYALKGCKKLYSYNTKAIWGNMDGPMDDHSKWSESDKDKYKISLKRGIEDMTQMNICMKQKHTHGHREQTCGF